MKQLTLTRRYRDRRAFTLIEIMIAVAIIALLCAIAVPGFIRARKRSQGVTIREDLRLIDYGTDQYAVDYNVPYTGTVPVAGWQLYINKGGRLYTTGTDIYGDIYGSQVAGTLPTVPSSAWDFLIDVCDSTFWSPYVRGN